jgi:hypothetical protein
VGKMESKEVRKMEMKKEYGEAVLVYECVDGEEFVYSYELLQKFRTSKLGLTQVYRDYVSDNEDEYFINKIYIDEEGNHWLYRIWVNESVHDKDIIQIYRIY